MPGTGEYVSDGKTWKPAMDWARVADATGAKDGEKFLGPDGKPFKIPNVAAVKAIKQELGYKPDDEVPLEALRAECAVFERNKQYEQLGLLNELLKTMATKESNAGKTTDQLLAVLIESVNRLAVAQAAAPALVQGR